MLSANWIRGRCWAQKDRLIINLSFRTRSAQLAQLGLVCPVGSQPVTWTTVVLEMTFPSE